jgi:hypothetical protein
MRIRSSRALWRRLCPWGLACVFAWNPVTTYTDGTFITAPVRYKMYFQAPRKATGTQVVDTDQTSAEILCPRSEYWVTAYIPGAESDPSNVVRLSSKK